MLQRLSIKNYALIDSLDISFSSGLTILTGETGAGKSIILGALSLILGQRAESRYFFNQEKKCVIEGSFQIGGYKLEDFFRQNDLDHSTETIIRREISIDGKSRAFINDTPATLSTLKELGEKLIDIHSQHATLELNSVSFQRLIVDSMADNQELLGAYRDAYFTMKKKQAELKQLENDLAQAQKDQDYLQFQFDELDKARLESGEQEQLEQELYTLTHAGEIKRHLLEAVYAMSESEQSAEQLIKQASQAVQNVEGKQKGLTEQSGRLQSLLIELRDISAELSSTEQKTMIDEQRLTEVNERLSEIFSLQKKHRVNTVDELIALRDELSGKLLSLNHADEDLLFLKDKIAGLHEVLIKQADDLFASREKAVPVIEKSAGESLSAMGMPDARIRIDLKKHPQNELDEYGADTIGFLFSANKGHNPAEMNKVASGGELSRLMLAIKALIAQKTALPTVIFDEIDAGISGETARRVGNVMEKLAENLQVITITHLPQIASKGSHHFSVYKQTFGDVTSTQIRPLNENGRVEEVARMLSGSQPTETSLQNARELLKK